MQWKWTFRHLHLASTTTHLDPDGLVAHFFLGYANNISEGEAFFASGASSCRRLNGIEAE
jgi:hypothetical protein